MDDDKLFKHLNGICIEMKYIWPTMRKDMNEIIEGKREISEVYSKPRVLHVSNPSPITSTSHNCEEKIEGQSRNGGESPRQPEPNPIVSELPLVRSAPIGREKVLEKKKGRPIRDSQLLLAGVSKVKCIMKHSKYCLEYFIPEGKFNKICKNCKQTHVFKSAV
jgi:hypothetical protein